MDYTSLGKIRKSAQFSENIYHLILSAKRFDTVYLTIWNESVLVFPKNPKAK